MFFYLSHMRWLITGPFSFGRAAAKAAIFLLPILGVWWLFGMFAVDDKTMIVFQYLFVIFNSSQGFFIFLFHFVFNSEVSILELGDFVPVNYTK